MEAEGPGARPPPKRPRTTTGSGGGPSLRSPTPPRAAAQALVPSRVIIHLDLDCFYCQVEQLRLAIPPGTPCAVQQWEGLIAVNYEARAAGVTRHMRASQAKKICPGIRLVHVETIGDGAREEAEEQAEPDQEVLALNKSRSKQKACLERYRQASLSILGLIRRTVAAEVVVEKASIDEVYLDVTPMVDAELASADEAMQDGDGTEAPSVFSWGSIVKGDTPLQPGSCFDRRFAIGASICARLRGLVRSELKYTMSGGVASNKLLAKLGSGMHKPNQQTIIPPRAIQGVMADLPLTKIGRLGGKLGAEVQQLGCTTAGEVAGMPLQSLTKHLGDQRGLWVYNAVHGICDEPVVDKGAPKSMLAAKSFEPTSDKNAIQRWIGILADELAGRMAADEETYHRRARNLVLHWRGGRGIGSGWGKERSKSIALPPDAWSGGRVAAAALARAGAALFAGAEDALPCSRLALSTTEFGEIPVHKAMSITRFFGHSPARRGGTGSPAVCSPAGSSDVAGNSKNGNKAPAVRGIQSYMTLKDAKVSPSPPGSPPRHQQPAAHQRTPGAFPVWCAGFIFQQPSPSMDKAALHEDENRSGAGYSAGTLGNIAAENLRTDGKAGAAFGSLDPPLWQPTASRAAEDDATMTSQAPVDAGLGQPNNPEDDGDISMADIDVEEQRRILRDIEMRRTAEGPRSPSGHHQCSASKSGKRPKTGAHGGGGKRPKLMQAAKSGSSQRSITSMFAPTSR